MILELDPEPETLSQAGERGMWKVKLIRGGNVEQNSKETELRLVMLSGCSYHPPIVTEEIQY